VGEDTHGPPARKERLSVCSARPQVSGQAKHLRRDIFRDIGVNSGVSDRFADRSRPSHR